MGLGKKSQQGAGLFLALGIVGIGRAGAIAQGQGTRLPQGIEPAVGRIGGHAFLYALQQRAGVGVGDGLRRGPIQRVERIPVRPHQLECPLFPFSMGYLLFL